MLRKDKERFDVFIMPKDLKVFNKDKRDSLLLNYNAEEEDQAFLDADTVKDEAIMDDAEQENGGAQEDERGTLSKLCTN